MNKIEIEVPDGKKAVWVDDVLTLVDDKPKDVRDRIKTFGDARKELGEDHQFVQEWKMIRKTLAPDLEAYMRLRIITAALNEGWEPQLTSDEHRWCIWFDMITKEQYDNLSDEEKENVICFINDSSNECLLYIMINIVSTSYCIYSCFSLFLRTSELALYASRQFAQNYIDLYFKPKYELQYKSFYRGV